MDNNELDWLELAREAAETSADYRDREGEYYHSIGREWAEIATIRARIAQAAALAAIAESMTAIVDKLDSIATEIGATSPNRMRNDAAAFLAYHDRQTARADAVERLTAEVARLKHSEAEAWAEVQCRDDSAEIDRDTLARLTADNAALRSQLAAAGEWRPVGEAPPRSGRYLTYSAGILDIHEYDDRHSQGWYGSSYGRTPTHWQALPAPPQK